MNARNIDDLKARAQVSPDGEAYALAAKEEGYRVGALASTSSMPEWRLEIEVLVQLCPSSGIVDLEVVGRRMGTAQSWNAKASISAT
jgi:hypothetical protein